MPTGSPFTSAQAPAAVQMLAPDIAAQQMQVARQQQMADLLRQQSIQPMGGTEMAGGWAVKRSPWESIAKLAQVFGANYAQKNVDEKQLGLAKALQGRYADILGGGNGTPPVAQDDPQGAPVSQTSQDYPRPATDNGAVQTFPVSSPDADQQPPVQGAPPAQPPSQPNAAPAQVTPNNFNMANLLRGQVINSLGGDQAGAAYWDQFKPTDGMRNDRYLGITPEQSRNSELAKRLKEGYIPPTSLRGQAFTDASGKITTLPDAAQPGYMNHFDQATGQWSTAPITGGVESVQGSERAKALGKTLGTLGQGFDADGKPTYFLGVPNGTSGAPTPQGQPPQGAMPHPGVPAQPPGAGQVDLNHMTPQQRQAFMAQADAQFGLRPGSTPGQSVQGPAPASTQATPASQAGVIRPGNAPGQNEFMQVRATAAGKRDNDLVTMVSDSPTRVNVLDNIIALSKNGVNTGPTAELTNQFKGAMSNVPGFGGWKDDVTGYQEMKKYLKQNGIRAWQAAGGSGTDAQLGAAMEANPNDKMFPKAVQMMSNWAKAGEIALQGKANAAQSAGMNTPADQARFEASWRQNMDPRIFQMKTMDPAEAQAFVANLKKTDPAGYQTLLKKAQTLKQMGGL